MPPSGKYSDSLYDRLKGDTDRLKSNNSSTQRQYEINEWTSNNKLDTLFFYQLLLITLTITAPLLYLQKRGIIPSTVFYGVVGVFGIAVVLTLLVRLQYTNGQRDLRFWNRRRFATMGGPPTAVSCDAIIAASNKAGKSLGSIASVIDKATTTTE